MDVHRLTQVFFYEFEVVSEPRTHQVFCVAIPADACVLVVGDVHDSANFRQVAGAAAMHLQPNLLAITGAERRKLLKRFADLFERSGLRHAGRQAVWANLDAACTDVVCQLDKRFGFVDVLLQNVGIG